MGKYYQQEIECASREEIKKMQSERLVKTVKRAYENSAYYKKLMDDAAAKGNYAQAAIYEQMRNEKIAGEGLNQWAQTGKC